MGGQLSIFISDPPYSVQNSYFLREKAFVVSTKTDSSQPDIEDEGKEDFIDNYDDDDDDEYPDIVINARKSLPLRLREDESDQKRLARILERLLDAVRDKIQ